MNEIGAIGFVVVVLLVVAYVVLKPKKKGIYTQYEPPGTKPPVDWDTVWSNAALDPNSPAGKALLETIRRETGQPNWQPKAN